MKTFFHSFLSLLCPPICANCHELMEPSATILCQHCLQELFLINPHGRCPFCFTDEIDGTGKPCDSCLTKEKSCDYVGSAFDYHGAPKSLVQQLKYHDRPYLAKSLAAFMYLQFHELAWPEPDLITCIPQSFSRSLQRGYNVSELLAKELSLLIGKPVSKLLEKNESTISQTHLERKDRKALLSTALSCKKTILIGNAIEDKVLLLVDDVYTTGTTIDCAALALQAGHPKRVYALTLCRS